MSPTTPLSSEDEIERLVRRFVDRTLPKREWIHAAHFGVALRLLAHHPLGEVERELPPLIRAYNEATGVANTDDGGYHETITLASIRAADAFLRSSPVRPLSATVDALMASRYGSPDWVFAHWTRGRLFSVAARRAWCDPDLAPLPF